MSISEPHVHEDPCGGIPPIPVRMLNEFVCCPRLGHLMWVREFAGSGLIFRLSWVFRGARAPASLKLWRC